MVAVVVVVAVAVAMAGHFEAGGVVEVKAQVVAGKVEAGEAGMVVVEDAVDTEAHRGHIVADGGEEMAPVAEKL